MKSRFSRLLAPAVVLGALALPAAAQAYYPSGPQQNVSKADLLASGWTVCHATNFDSEWVGLGSVDTACTGQYLMLAGGVVGSPNWSLLAAAPRSTVLAWTGDQWDPTPSVTVNANGSEWYRAGQSSWGFAPAGATVTREAIPSYECDINTGQEDLRMCWRTHDGYFTPGGRIGATWALSPNISLYDRAVLQLTPRVRTSGTPVAFTTQPLSTVSAKQTITLTVSGDPGLTPAERASGKLTVTGAQADEFDIIDNDCPPVEAPDNGSVTCTVTIRFVPQASGVRTAALSFANAVGTVALAGNGGQLPQGPQGPSGTNGTNGTSGANGANGTNGTNGNDGKDGATGPQGPVGKDGANGNDGAKGAKGEKGVAVKFAKRGKTRVGCNVSARGAGSRIVCQLNRRSGRSWLMQLRDRRGALSTAAGNGESTMVFLSARKPRGTMHAFVIKGLPTS